MTHTHKSLAEIHEDVPPDHYDKGIKRNIFQKYWHHRRFSEVLNALIDVKGPVLDVGCHSGTFTERIINRLTTKKLYGIDISSSAIKLAKKRLPFGHFVAADATKLSFKTNFFDAAFCLEMLEHVDDPKAILSEVKRVLKKGGYALILVPTDNNLFKFVWLLWTVYYPVWRHAHVQSYKGHNLEEVVESLDFKVEKIKTFNAGMLKLIICRKK